MNCMKGVDLTSLFSIHSFKGYFWNGRYVLGTLRGNKDSETNKAAQSLLIKIS